MVLWNERIAVFKMEKEGGFHKNPTTQENTLVTMRSQQGFYKGAGEQSVLLFEHVF
jgi:hypothetical protein